MKRSRGAFILTVAVALALTIGATERAQAAPREKAASQATTRVTIAVRDDGFHLSRSAVPAGPVQIIAVNRTDRQIVIRVGGPISRSVAPGGRTRLRVNLRRSGSVRISVPRLGVSGTLFVKEHGVKLTRVANVGAGLVQLAAAPGNRTRLFVAEKVGRIRVILNGKLRDVPFLDLSDSVASAGGEQGLLSIVFAPDYEDSGLFYALFSGLDETVHIEQFRRSRKNPNRADPASRRLILRVEPARGDHYGGMLQFGPDGFLYASVGDGGLGRNYNPMRAQQLDDLNGTILRIDPTTGRAKPYRIPKSNPFVGAPGRDEIWAYGLRNPWRFWIDRVTGDLYIGDAGEFVRESIDYANPSDARGGNFGWPCFEGGLQHRPERLCPGAIPPLFEYAREDGYCAVIGGVVVRDPRLPGLSGSYLFSDFCKGTLKSLERTRSGSALVRSLHLERPAVTSFGIDNRERVYITSLNGSVWRLDPRLRPRSARNGGGAAENGKALFQENGCGNCHTLAAANATGTIGPNLDQTKPSLELALDRLRNGKGGMPSFEGIMSDDQLDELARFVVESTSAG